MLCLQPCRQAGRTPRLWLQQPTVPPTSAMDVLAWWPALQSTSPSAKCLNCLAPSRLKNTTRAFRALPTTTHRAQPQRVRVPANGWTTRLTSRKTGSIRSMPLLPRRHLAAGSTWQNTVSTVCRISANLWRFPVRVAIVSGKRCTATS